MLFHLKALLKTISNQGFTRGYSQVGTYQGLLQIAAVLGTLPN